FYIKDTYSGDYYPAIINYTGNSTTGAAPSSSVVFVVEGRPDVVPAYLARSVVTTVNRIKYVRTFSGSNLVKEYRLAYDNGGVAGRSRLTSITECDSSSGGACLNPTSINYPTNVTQFMAPTSYWLQSTDPGTGTPTYNPSNCFAFVADFDGDGKADYMWNYNGIGSAHFLRTPTHQSLMSPSSPIMNSAT